jgi:hypothetical protein
MTPRGALITGLITLALIALGIYYAVTHGWFMFGD